MADAAASDPPAPRDHARVPRRAELLLFAAVPLLALLVRGIYLLEIRDAPLFTLLIGDAMSYDRWGRAIAGGDWLSREVTGPRSFYQAPLYPYFLGVLYALFGHSLLAVRLLQALLGAAACWLLARAGRRLFGLTAGLAAGLLFALYPPAIFFDGLIQKSALDGFFVALLLYLLARQSESPRPALWPPVGAALGFLVLARENALLLVVVVLLWAATRKPQGPAAHPHAPERRFNQYRPRLIAAGLLLAGLAAVLLPVALRNKAVGGEFHLTTSQFGPNLYIGNNPRATGTYMPLRPGRGDPLYERFDAEDLAEQAQGRELTPKEVSEYWAERAFDFIESEKAAWLRLIGRKTLMLLGRVEIGDTEDLYTYSDWSLLLRALGGVLHWGVVLPLAAVGIVLAAPRWRRLWLFYKLILAYAATVVLFYVVARYRYPLAPMVILFAGAGVALAVEAARRGAWRRLVAALAVGAAVALLSNAWRGPSPDDSRAVTLSNIGYGLTQQQGRTAEAIPYLRRAVELRPTYAPARYNLGAALVNEGRHAEAVAHLTEAVRHEPALAEAQYQLGATLLALDRPEAAIAPLTRTADLRPSDAAARLKLGVALARQGRIGEAAAQFVQAARLEPDSADAAYNAGNALLHLRRYPEAEAWLERAMRLRPDAQTAAKLSEARAGAAAQHGAAPR